MSDMERLQQLKAEIVEQRRLMKQEKDEAALSKGKGEMIDAVSIAIHSSGLKLYTMDGRLINSLTWPELDEMRKEAKPDNYLVTEGKASPQVLFRESFQNFLYFCNNLYLPPELETLSPELVNNPQIDPNTRAFIDMIIHYEMFFEKNEQWKKSLGRFMKWMCFLFKEDGLMRERLGWMFWWWIVKHGNKMVLWDSQYDPKHWTPYTDGDIMRDVIGPVVAKPLTEGEQNDIMRRNEEAMRNGSDKGAT
jgi:hypothetical protein